MCLIRVKQVQGLTEHIQSEVAAAFENLPPNVIQDQVNAIVTALVPTLVQMQVLATLSNLPPDFKLILPQHEFMYWGDPFQFGAKRVGWIGNSFVIQQFNGGDWQTIYQLGGDV